MTAGAFGDELVDVVGSAGGEIGDRAAQRRREAIPSGSLGTLTRERCPRVLAGVHAPDRQHLVRIPTFIQQETGERDSDLADSCSSFEIRQRADGEHLDPAFFARALRLAETSSHRPRSTSRPRTT